MYYAFHRLTRSPDQFQALREADKVRRECPSPSRLRARKCLVLFLSCRRAQILTISSDPTPHSSNLPFTGPLFGLRPILVGMGSVTAGRPSPPTLRVVLRLSYPATSLCAMPPCLVFVYQAMVLISEYPTGDRRDQNNQQRGTRATLRT
jgi:hypothetical protein